MYEHFKSDVHIFSNDILFLIDLKAKPQILEIAMDKHKRELADQLSIENKRTDLLIWNAIYTKEIIKHGI